MSLDFLKMKKKLFTNEFKKSIFFLIFNSIDHYTYLYHLKMQVLVLSNNIFDKKFLSVHNQHP